MPTVYDKAYDDELNSLLMDSQAMNSLVMNSQQSSNEQSSNELSKHCTTDAFWFGPSLESYNDFESLQIIFLLTF